MLKFTKDHEWLRIEGEIATVGITSHAQHQLGDIVYVELPQLGRVVEQGAVVAVVESVKAASEIYAPVSGQIAEINEAITKEPALVNQEPMGSGWFFRVKLNSRAQLDSLLDEEAYTAIVG